RTLDEVYAWDQVESQGLLGDVDHPVLGTIQLPGPPLRFFDAATAEETTRTTHTSPPLLNADAESIRSWLEEENPASSTGD
ncbi:MAG: CoA transferase, partial [Micrococcaceae bacterium]|nr:CoA transferase [Micrococcaceae bacterium]